MSKNANDEKVECRTPNKDRPGTTRIPKWKFDVVSKAIKTILRRERSVAFKELPALVQKILTKEEIENLGSLGWHVTTVKLEMEVRGDIVRLEGKGPHSI